MSPTDDQPIKIHHVRYQAAGEYATKPKGLILFVHGFGDYVSRYPYLGKYFADRGYEFAGMDQRGFGNSEGVRAKVESVISMTVDNETYHRQYVDTYPYLRDVPKFVVACSFGGQIGLNLIHRNEDFYSGVIFVVPYFRHKYEDSYRKLLPAINFTSYIGLRNLAVK